MKSSILIFAVTGALLFIAVVTFFFTYEDTLKNQFHRVLAFTVTSGLTGVHTLVAGQLNEDVTSDLLKTLKTVNWECWNYENRKTFVILLQNTQKCIKIKFSENVSVNYALGVSLGRAVYSVMSVMRQLKN
ncbi:hypothetical protein TcasGA2_TC031305 [Tribolium castaneum]|uniref:Uncharacterized protein n=1 Tax=Tribolium castaneum TaxID=7070 RepID=A0A139WB34_TRICA|nr:PREDICTED: uncharacterized protein LOC107398728 isoform X2 [Tribolium castaneum]KYB25158.1 hypothetical protein TcasGA2_TC031305 [Tribolium castaneum]|eukprot:XP_015839386.1 PREDICTED: uncharacterized protein LOC107398728 isoform X2 [Tribolium castaneum]